MGVAVNIDWEYAKLLRFEGFTFKDIAAKLGCKENTLMTRASREKWHLAQAKVKDVVKAEVQGRAILTLQERAARFTAAMADDVDATLDHVKKMGNPDNWEELVKAETVKEKLTKRGRATYGLDQAGPSTVVNVAIMGEVLSNPATDVQVVDVAEVKQEMEG